MDSFILVRHLLTFFNFFATEEEKKEILVIKSDKEWIQYFKARVSGIIPFMLMEIVVVIAFNYDLRKRKAVVPEIANVLEKCIIVGFIIVNIFLILNIYRMWRDIGRELILDKMGVLAKMCFYEKIPPIVGDESKKTRNMGCRIFKTGGRKLSKIRL